MPAFRDRSRSPRRGGAPNASPSRGAPRDEDRSHRRLAAAGHTVIESHRRVPAAVPHSLTPTAASHAEATSGRFASGAVPNEMVSSARGRRARDAVFASAPIRTPRKNLNRSRENALAGYPRSAKREDAGNAARLPLMGIAYPWDDRLRRIVRDARGSPDVAATRSRSRHEWRCSRTRSLAPRCFRRQHPVRRSRCTPRTLTARPRERERRDVARRDHVLHIDRCIASRVREDGSGTSRPRTSLALQREGIETRRLDAIFITCPVAFLRTRPRAARARVPRVSPVFLAALPTAGMPDERTARSKVWMSDVSASHFRICVSMRRARSAYTSCMPCVGAKSAPPTEPRSPAIFALSSP